MNLSPQHLEASPSLHQKPERTPLVSLPPLPHPSPPLSLAAPLTPILVVESGLFGLTKTATESVLLPTPRWAGGLQLGTGRTERSLHEVQLVTRHRIYYQHTAIFRVQ